MVNPFWIALRVTLVTLVLTGVVYPLVGTGLAQVLFSRQAGGSLTTDNRGRTTGSELIGQRFDKPYYFQGRPSAAGDQGYDATSSGGSNLSPTSKKLRDRAAKDVSRLLEQNPEAARPIPSDLVTASASGLDPHISPAAALWQVSRVAKARNINPDRVHALVEGNVEGRDFGLFGEPRVNVLLLNLALDRQFGEPALQP